jgi:hypothetical protein
MVGWVACVCVTPRNPQSRRDATKHDKQSLNLKYIRKILQHFLYNIKHRGSKDI